MNRKLNRCLDRTTLRTLSHYAARLQKGARRLNYLTIALRSLESVVRLHRKWIREMPEYFDEKLIAERRREAEQERWSREVIQPMLDRIYALPWPDIPEKQPEQK